MHKFTIFTFLLTFFYLFHNSFMRTLQLLIIVSFWVTFLGDRWVLGSVMFLCMHATDKSPQFLSTQDWKPSSPPPHLHDRNISLVGTRIDSVHEHWTTRYTVKKVTDFPVPSRDVINKTLLGGGDNLIIFRQLVIYIPAWDGKIGNLFYSVRFKYYN
jgi:hypothetical protein